MIGSISNGALFQGLNQSAQQQIDNQSRAAYLAIMQSQEGRNQSKFDTDRADALAQRQGADTAAFMGIPGAQKMPDFNGPAPAPNPGQSSLPSSYAGAQTQPVKPQGQVQGEPLPPMGSPATGPAGPAGAAMPQAAQAQPQAGSAMPQAPGAPQQPQQPGGDDGLSQLTQMLDQVNKNLQTPVAQRIAADPSVKKAQDNLQKYVDKLRAQGIDPSQPGGKQPSLAEHYAMQNLHLTAENAASAAAKNLGADESNAVKLGADYIKAIAQKNVWEYRAQMMATRGQGGGGGRNSVAPGTGFDDMSDAAKKSLVVQYQKFGPNALPWSRSRNQGGEIAKFQDYMAAQGTTGGDLAVGRAGFKADTASLQNVQKQADQMERSYNTLHDNMDYMLKVAKDYGLQGNQPVNMLVNKVRMARGDEAAAQLVGAISSVQREYGRVSEGSTGAGATTATSLKNAEAVLHGDFTLAQFEGAAKTMKNDGSNVIKYYKQQVSDIQGRIRGGKTGGAGNIVSKSSDADVAAAAKALGITPDEFRKTMGQ